MSFSQHLEIETYNNIIHKVCLWLVRRIKPAQLSPRLCTLTVSVSSGQTWKRRGRGGARNKENISTDFLGCFSCFTTLLYCYWWYISSTINVLWPNAVEPLPECPNVLWSEIQMEKLVLRRWETGDWSIIEIF